MLVYQRVNGVEQDLAWFSQVRWWEEKQNKMNIDEQAD
jgi:hypothetical protein